MLLVFDVGGTFIKYAWMTREGDILEKSKIPTNLTPGFTAEDFVEDIYKIYCKYKQKEMPEGIAMALPGQIDIENGIVYGGGALGYLDQVKLAAMISAKCDGLKVTMENDGKCAALAEIWQGNAKDVNDACVLVIGTGIGGGIIIDRKVHHGKRMLAGEESYMILNMTREEAETVVPIETLPKVTDVFGEMPYIASASCASAGLTFKYAVAKGLPENEVSGELIYEAAANGDEVAINLLEDMYFSIAKMCINLFVTLDPEVILLGGGISAAPEFVDGVRRYVDKIKKMVKFCDAIKIDGCKFLSDSNLLGAVYNYIQLEQ